MENSLHFLEQARAALMEFDAPTAQKLLEEFETSLSRDGLTEESAKRCAQELAAIRDLAAAARDGVRSAQQQFREILELSQRLDTYDRAGNRKAEQIASPSARKF